MALLTERYAKKIRGILSFFDRIIIQGTLPVFCYAEGMTSFLHANNIRIFDYPRFAEPLRNELRENAEQIAKENGVSIKMYDKLSLILRIETTANNVSFFKHYRKVEHRDGTRIIFHWKTKGKIQ